MSTKGKPVLGRGLASLIPRATTSTPPVRQDDGVATETIVQIDVDKIRPNPYQPRAEFDQVELDELKQSIVEKGIIQPITVSRADGGGYQLISGERRLRASKQAGLARIPAYIIRIQSQEELLELALIENLQRSQLNPIEIAISYKRLTEELHFTMDQVSRKTGKDRSTITNFLRLLKLPDVIQNAVRKGDVSAGHARALITIDDTAIQMQIFHKIMSKGLSVREVEKAVRDSGKSKARKPSKADRQRPVPSSSLTNIEERLRQKLGTKVEVRDMADGKGTIVIEYYSLDDLDRLLDLFASIQS